MRQIFTIQKEKIKIVSIQLKNYLKQKWFEKLILKTELDIIYQAWNLGNCYGGECPSPALSGFNSSFYWSSTANTSSAMWNEYFLGGNQGVSTGTTTYGVRCVRR